MHGWDGSVYLFYDILYDLSIHRFYVWFQIFEKALEEPKYSALYAQLCHRLCEDSPNFDSQSNVTVSFVLDSVDWQFLSSP